MSSKLSIIRNITMAVLAFFAMTAGARAQDAEQLLNQLCGKAEGPQRNAEQLAQAYQKAIDYLLPLMSAEDVGSRYNPQISLQDMGSHASRPGAEAEREVLARVMCKNVETAEMPATVRNWFVLQLQRIGEDESVRTLANLLSSKEKPLRDYARRALEKNPSRSALRSLERALKEARDPVWKIGLLHSIGQRPELEAIGSLTRSLQDADPKVVAAAVSALAETPCPQNVSALTDFLKKASGANQIKTAQALLYVADRLARQQKFNQAMDIYGHLNNWTIDQEKRGQDVFFVRAAALNGMAICDGQVAARIAASAIKSKNPKIQSIAVQAARNAPTKAATGVLTRMLSELAPYFQKQVLGLIADRGDLSSTRFVKEVLACNDESVRLAAIDALTQIGGDEAAEALLEIAANDQGAAKKAAVEGLAVMVGPRVEEVIKDQAASGAVNARVAAIGLLGDRGASGAGEILLGYADDDNADICAAAFEALAAVADAGDIAMLAGLLAETAGSEARGHGVTALKSVLAGAEDKDTAARIIIDRMKTSGEEAGISLLSSLNALGGSAALEAVIEAAQSSNNALREAGIRTLSDWPDYEAAEKLLGIAARPDTALNHYVLAMRGALRLIRTNTSAPLDDRAALCFDAFDRARRDEEKKQAVSAMGSVPSKKVAARLLALTKDDKLRTEAGLAAVELAGNMLATDRQAARDLAQKVRDMDISEEINRRADSVIRGRRRR
jgi:HEAT repeat protein